MRIGACVALTLASFAMLAPAPSSADSTRADRQIIVAFAGTPPAHAALASQTAGLRRLGALADGLPASPSPRTLHHARADRAFGLEGASVILFEAPDSAAASRALLRLTRDPDVLWAERNVERLPMHRDWSPLGATGATVDSAFPDDPLFRAGRQWGLANPTRPGADIHATAAWALSRGGNHVRLAIADTGIDPAHPDLAAAMPDGRARLELAVNVTDDPTRSTLDLYGHGTPVAGVMAALTHNGATFDSLGIAGVCGGDGVTNRGCSLVPIKITSRHSGSATAWDIARAILYATRVRARALNLSFGSLAPSRLERLALHEAITHGCVVVAAAGNWAGRNGGIDPVYPAAYAADGSCIQAGGSDPRDGRATFSSHGPGLDLMAPATDVWTTFMTYPSHAGAVYPGYVAGSGTSFAAPHVAGVVGLLAGLRPELTDTDFQHVLREAAHDLGAPGPDAETGWGRLDAARALAAVGPEIGIWHDEVPADRFAVVATDTLRLQDGAPFGRWAAGRLATLIEARATVALPDSFADSVRAWPRVGGTTTVRGGFAHAYLAPWCAIERVGRTLELSGYLFRLAECPECAEGDADIPLPLDQARFGFTVIGRVARGSERTAAPGRGAAPGLELAPNPFRGSLAIEAGGTALEILDLGGRVVRRFASGGGRVVWDGRDGRGGAAPPGLYWIRARRDGATTVRKAIKLE